MKAGGRYNIDNSTEKLVSGFDYAASALSYLFEDVTDSGGSLAAVLPVLEKGLAEIYACEFDVVHVSSSFKSLSEFLQNYLDVRAMGTQRVPSFKSSGFARGRRESFLRDRVESLREAGRPRGGEEEASPFTLEFSQNGGFVFEAPTPDDFVVQVALKQKGGTSYGDFLLGIVMNSGIKFFSDVQSVADMKFLMSRQPDDFNKHLGDACQKTFVDEFTNLYVDTANASGNVSARLLNISVEWQQDRTEITTDIGIYVQDFRI